MANRHQNRHQGALPYPGLECRAERDDPRQLLRIAENVESSVAIDVTLRKLMHVGASDADPPDVETGFPCFHIFKPERR
jgi:hypothetical protein